MHKSGFVNIVGNPNAGKSTLMNEFVGERLSIITPKAQTTRHRILGIVNHEDWQIVYSDTPGMLRPRYKMHEGMMQFVGTALADADILLFMVDLTDPTPVPEEMYARIRHCKVPLLVLLNKMDGVTEDTITAQQEYWKKELPDAEIYALSALHKKHVDPVFKRILELLPEHPPYYPKDELTDKSERFFVSEIIRGKILELYEQEIPYASEVQIEEFKETEQIIRIRAIVYVMRESQKAILLGHQGKAIRNLGIHSRQTLEEFLQKKVFLDLHIKVDKDWRDSERRLKYYGYLGR
jgi:GTP-binding protein Era